MASGISCSTDENEKLLGLEEEVRDRQVEEGGV